MKHKSVLAVLAVALFATLLPSAALAEPDENGIYPMVFPVQGEHRLTNNFGAPRGGGTRSHEGEDIMADKGVPVVAVADGTVKWVGSTCCYLAIEHPDGWETRYIHLNNDTQNLDGTYNDLGDGWGIADGIEPGVEVSAGQVIGWVGDSGNAEGTAPHLHFELRDPSGTPYNPYESLLAAQPVPDQEPPCPDGEICDVAAFQDLSGQFHVWDELVWGSPTSVFYYGNPGDVAFSGDWDCDGVDTLGLYRRSDGYAYLRNSNTQGVADITFFFGNPGDFPVAGDFNGDGCDTVSIYRPAEATFYIINELGSNDGGLGAAEYSFMFGVTGDKPFVGDFDGDGVDTVGLHRESTGLVYYRDSNETGTADAQFIFGDPGDMITAGDWDGDGDDTVALYRSSDDRIYLKNDNSAGVADVVLYAGSRTGVVALRR
jgi:murein DD-endopeptidase MepM/ murein hydrolase activator NlpD